jgi:DNA-binding MarR family transcriptional regulator
LTTPGEIEPGWLTISDLARERGVDKSAISRRVARLEGQGLLTTRTRGKAKLVNLAEFDRAAAATVDAVREMNGRRAAGSLAADEVSGDPNLAREQARRAKIQADLAKLDLDERLDRLVDREAIGLKLDACMIEALRVVDQLPSRSDALASALVEAMTKEGAEGLRKVLRAADRAYIREIREAVARVAERFADSDDLGEIMSIEVASEGVDA